MKEDINCISGVCDMKNQTTTVHIPSNEEAIGIAFFVNRVNGELSKTKVEDITYSEAKSRGENCIAFKFLLYGNILKATDPSNRFGEDKVIGPGIFD